jgi:hypothetical protein
MLDGDEELRVWPYPRVLWQFGSARQHHFMFVVELGHYSISSCREGMSNFDFDIEERYLPRAKIMAVL